MELKQRLTKAIAFFRTFSDKADSALYKKSVLRFCSLVEEFLADDKSYENAKKVFNE